MTDTAERREYAMQIITAGMLHRLLKAEGNEAAELLIYDIKAASLARTFREMNERYANGNLVPLVLFPRGSTKRMKILGPLI